MRLYISITLGLNLKITLSMGSAIITESRLEKFVFGFFDRIDTNQLAHLLTLA